MCTSIKPCKQVYQEEQHTALQSHHWSPQMVNQNKLTENCDEEPIDKKLMLDQKEYQTDKSAIDNHINKPAGDKTMKDVTNQTGGVHVSKNTSVTLDNTQSILNNETVYGVQNPICDFDEDAKNSTSLVHQRNNRVSIKHTRNSIQAIHLATQP